MATSNADSVIPAKNERLFVCLFRTGDDELEVLYESTRLRVALILLWSTSLPWITTKRYVLTCTNAQQNQAKDYHVVSNSGNYTSQEGIVKICYRVSREGLQDTVVSVFISSNDGNGNLKSPWSCCS
jgi:hypothetical protein